MTQKVEKVVTGLIMPMINPVTDFYQ